MRPRRARRSQGDRREGPIDSGGEVGAELRAEKKLLSDNGSLVGQLPRKRGVQKRGSTSASSIKGAISGGDLSHLFTRHSLD